MLLDTSGLLSLHHAAEPCHRLATDLFENIIVRLTHSYVLAEFVPLAQSRGVPREPALVFLSDLQIADEVTMIWVDEVLHNEAMNLLLNRLDKTYSLCDAVSYSHAAARPARCAHDRPSF